MLPLTLAAIGENNFIKKICGNSETKIFLEKLGFVVGGSIIVIHKIRDNVIVNVKDTRIAISKEMASKIMV